MASDTDHDGDRAVSQHHNRSLVTTPTTLLPLSGDFKTVTVSGTAVNVPGPVRPYDGTQLFMRSSIQQIAGVDTLVVEVDDQGGASAAPGTSAQAVLVILSFGSSATAPPVQVPVPGAVYNGGPLTMTVSVQPSPTPWNNTSFILSIVEGNPAVTGIPAGFVIVEDDLHQFQLRWVDLPVGVAVPQHSVQFIPSPLETPGSGIGISGPFGFENP